MIFLHLNPTKRDTATFNKYVEEGKDMFVLFYMEGCGPCNATRPEWGKLEHILKDKYKHNNNIVVVDIDQELLNEIKYIGTPISGFPTMRYIGKKGKVVEEYENSKIKQKDRKANSFVEWIALHVQHKEGHGQKGGSKQKGRFRSRRRKNKKTKTKKNVTRRRY